jgi:hypothetical protein
MQNNFINLSKHLVCSGWIKELSLKTKVLYLASILISSFKIRILIFKCSFKIFIQFLLRRASLKTASYILNMINCIQYHYCLDVTSCQQAICHRRFDTNLNTHLHKAKYSWYCRHLNMKTIGCLETSNTNYQVTRRRKARN